MCRMFAYAGDSRNELEDLAGMLLDSARRDRVAEKLGMAKTTHPDGWGYVVCSSLGCRVGKYGTSITGERDVKAHIPPTSGKTLAIFHVRRATRGPIGESASQPFWADSSNGTLYLAHNGSLDMDGMRKDLGLTGETDSEMTLNYAVRHGLPAAAMDLWKYVDSNSALNLLALERRRDGTAELYASWHYKEGSPDITAYYEMMYQHLPHGKAVFSSTLNEYGLKGRPLPQGQLVTVSELDNPNHR